VKRTGRFKLHRFALGEEFGDGVVISRVVGHVLYMYVCVFMRICVQISRAVFRYLSSGFLKISSVCAVYSRDVTQRSKETR